MKKYLGFCVAIAFSAAYDGAQTTQEPNNETAVTETASLKGQQLIAASDCLC